MQECKNCGKSISEKYCSHCGQKKYDEKDKSVVHIFEEAFHFLTHFEGSYFTSLKTIFTKPGKLSVDYSNGIRKKYYKPISMFFMVVILYLIYPIVSGLNQEFKYYNNNFGMSKYSTQSIKNKILKNNISLESLETQYNQKSKSVSKILLFAFIPFSVLFLYMLFFTSKKWMFDYFIIATEINTIYIFNSFILIPAILVLFSKIFGISFNFFSDIQLAVFTIILFLIYVFWIFKNVFIENHLSIFLKSTIFVVLHSSFLLFLYRYLVFYVTLWII